MGRIPYVTLIMGITRRMIFSSYSIYFIVLAGALRSALVLNDIRRRRRGNRGIANALIYFSHRKHNWQDKIRALVASSLLTNSFSSEANHAARNARANVST
jgi:hypothetical protein